MKRFLTAVYKVDISFQMVAGIGLVFMMAMTMADITMRALGRPIVGSIELISFSGAIIIGFAVPYSSWMRSHVIVDFLVERLSPRARRSMELVTKLAGVVLFLFMGVNFVLYSLTLMKTGEVSAGLRIPYYPITFGLALSCFLESLTLFADLMKVSGGRNDE
ncbi:MAG: TRAP transporter small permease [Syntrophorhabdales bacterium]|jgi:TRAP-type C4-dicarboxylate transport system permease small subunit